jgi:hypothetical protein
MSTPKLFRPLDLVVPLGSCLLAAGLCMMGVMGQYPTPAKIVCAVTGLLFLATPVVWYIMRWVGIRYDYQTVQGIFVRRGKVNRPEKPAVEKWTDELVQFWSDSEMSKVYKLNTTAILLAISNVWATFSDMDKVEVPRPSGLRGFVVGYAREAEVLICLPMISGGSGNAHILEEEAIHSLFKHELSHIIIGKQTGITGEEEHHRIFRDNNLGA